MQPEILRLLSSTGINNNEYRVVFNLELKQYSNEILESFNEWLRDNYDAFIFDDKEACADEILFNFFPIKYKEELEEFVSQYE